MKLRLHHHHTSVPKRILQLLLVFTVLGTGFMVATHQSQAAQPASLNGSAYRLYRSSSSVNPGQPLAAASTAAHLPAPGQTFRLRAGVSEQPLPLTWRMVSATYLHACAIANDETVYCWGRNNVGQLGDGSTTDRSAPVPVKKDGVLSGKTILQVAAAGDHSCVLASDNWVYCWGEGGGGRLGNGSTSSSSVPVAVQRGAIPNGVTIRHITVGYHYTCAIASDHKAYCWGQNQFGQLGSGHTDQYRTTPVAVSMSGELAGKTMRQIAGGGYHTCAIASDNNAYCWGYGGNGQLGNGTGGQSRVPVPVLQGATVGSSTPGRAKARHITAGLYHSCIIGADGRPYCWGHGGEGRLGNGSTNGSSVPVAVLLPSSVLVRHIAAGMEHTCAAGLDGRAYCWGNGGAGQLGNSATGHSLTPVAASLASSLNGKRVQLVAAANGYSCGLTTDGMLHCWGDNAHGRLGNNTTSASSVAVAVTPTVPKEALSKRIVQEISQGQGGSTCAILFDGWAYCWGANNAGQLGNGTTTFAQQPTPVSRGVIPDGTTFRQVAIGGTHTCAIGSDEKVYCWGKNNFGQLGNGTTNDSATPVAVVVGQLPDGGRALSVAAGSSHTCVIGTNYQLYCWGLNNGGQLGDATMNNRTTPVAVQRGALPANRQVRQVSAGNSHNCVVASDDRAYCWGGGYRGALGNASSANQLTPAAVSRGAMQGDMMVHSVAAGYWYSCAIGTNNRPYCWGWNEDGQLGNNSTTDSSVPVLVLPGALPGGGAVQQLSVGSLHSCAVGVDDRAYCWGEGPEGRLGNNSLNDAWMPVAVHWSGALSGLRTRYVSANHSHSCMVALNGQAYCWGKGAEGRLGNNATAQSAVPVEVDKVNNRAQMNDRTFKLQYAKKTVTTCQAQTSGYTDVTANSAIAYYPVGAPQHTAAIAAATSGDPLPSWQIAYQSVRAQPGPFQPNQEVLVGKTALWDFALKDNGAARGASYCMRIVAASGAPIQQYDAVAELAIPGSLSVDIVNAVGVPVSHSSFAMDQVTFSTAAQGQTTQGKLGSPAYRLRVSNSLSATGWSLSVAPTHPGQGWQRQGGGGSYAYNGTAASGQLEVNPVTGAVAGATGSCSTSGITKGPRRTYSSSVGSIVLMEASASAALDCSWDLQGVDLKQSIPARQPAGSYALDLTVTVVAK